MTSKGEICFRRISCCVITGASRGLGKSIALKFAAKFPAKSVFILLSRDTASLSDVKREIALINQGTKTVTKEFDQSLLNQANFDSLFQDVFRDNGLSVSDFEQAVMIHNAGTVGDITKYVRDVTDAKKVKENFDINVSGMILLNGAFLQMFKKELVKHRIVINISSLAGIQPVKSWSLYCSAIFNSISIPSDTMLILRCWRHMNLQKFKRSKAARDMFFRVLASEEPDIRVLNYAPALHEKKGLLDCDTSISKLIQILENDTYESGAHICYDKLYVNILTDLLKLFPFSLFLCAVTTILQLNIIVTIATICRTKLFTDRIVYTFLELHLYSGQIICGSRQASRGGPYRDPIQPVTSTKTVKSWYPATFCGSIVVSCKITCITASEINIIVNRYWKTYPHAPLRNLESIGNDRFYVPHQAYV
ncbi:hypothetical protein KUTeg_008505 [Tegillarca granosa]|uniref:Sepiapterin reductase n=1 Tax=Tegillarca granosa TaxID=220873 RepID=A0ABQ9F9B1_TEGGR|nr:hypothetical protein KUTeg_008505 [Tegillarca granosa]